MNHLLSEEESRRLAKHIVQELIRQLDDEETIDKITTKWGVYLDRWIGKNFRRVMVILFTMAVGALAVKYQIWAHLPNVNK